MILGLICVGVIALVTYLWVIRGFLSAFLHMVCVVAAGAIAFAFWEPIAYLILEKAPERGILDFVGYNAWAIALVVPFAVAVALLRLGVDKIVPGNAQAVPAVDYVGGGVCGVVSGVITAGILAIAYGTMTFKADGFGFTPVSYAGGSIERESRLLVPVDQLVGKFYAATSERSYSTGQPLARWRPEPWHAAEVMRMSDRDGLGRNTASPKDFSFMGRYTVEAAGNEHLLQDKWASKPHEARKLNGDPYRLNGARIEGIILSLNSSLKEPKQSYVSITEAQVWMVAENPTTGERQVLHPVAAIANPKGAETSLARFEFNSKLSIASAGASVRPMAFEFVVEQGFEPLAIYLKNIRAELVGRRTETEFPSVAARDAAIESGSLIAGSTALDIDALTGENDRDSRPRNPGNQSPEELAEALGISVDNRLPNRRVIQKGATEKGLTIGDGNKVMAGEAKWEPSALGGRGLDAQLRIERFNVNPDVVMVQVEVSPERPLSLLGKAAAAAQRVMPPLLVDTNGIAYEAYGWWYEDREMIYCRYTPSQSVRGLTMLTQNGIQLSGSRDDQKLYLLFLCSLGAEIQSFKIGDKVIQELEKPLPLDEKQK